MIVTVDPLAAPLAPFLAAVHALAGAGDDPFTRGTAALPIRLSYIRDISKD